MRFIILLDLIDKHQPNFSSQLCLVHFTQKQGMDNHLEPKLKDEEISPLKIRLCDLRKPEISVTWMKHFWVTNLIYCASCKSWLDFQGKNLNQSTCVANMKTQSLRASHCYVHSQNIGPQKTALELNKISYKHPWPDGPCIHLLKNLHLSFLKSMHQAKSIEGIQHEHSTGTLSKPKTTQNLGKLVGTQGFPSMWLRILRLQLKTIHLNLTFVTTPILWWNLIDEISISHFGDGQNWRKIQWALLWKAEYKYGGVSLLSNMCNISIFVPYFQPSLLAELPWISVVNLRSRSE